MKQIKKQNQKQNPKTQNIISLIQQRINQNSTFRKKLALSNLSWFATIYFGKYLFYPTAPFQKEIYQILEGKKGKQSAEDLFSLIIAFRGSAKTTIAMLIYAIYEIISDRKHFIVLISDTGGQIKEHIYNIKAELETNQRLIQDFGPFEFEQETQKKQEWQATSMIIPQYDTKIVGKSTGQKVRGIRYKQWRPDLIIVDDIEDLEMVRTKEQRDKTHRWLTGNVIPAGEKGKTKYILIGNMLHSDAIMSRIKKEIEKGDRDGRVVEFPLIDEDGKIAWEGKYPDMDAIEVEKRKIGKDPIGRRAWLRELLLKLVPEEGQIIHDEWIKHYDKIPEQTEITEIGTGIDLAISKEDTAKFTAMVSGKLTMVDGNPKLYIMPYPVNERLTFDETIKKAEEVSRSMAVGTGVELSPLWVEDVGYQKAAIQEMVRKLLPAKGVGVTSDKAARLRTASGYVQSGIIVFPEKGCEDLITQLVGFGIEAFCDLVDGFTLLVYSMILNMATNYTGFYEYMRQEAENIKEKKSPALQDFINMFNRQR